MGATRAAEPAGFDFGAAGGAFLAEASRLLADSLDYETTLTTIAHLALPHLGAWCIVDVVEEDDSMRRLAVVHPDPHGQALARRLARGWPPRADDPLGVPVAVRTRRSEVIPRVTEDLLAEAAHGSENLELLRQLGMGSLIVAPMLARGQVHGAITFVSPAPGEYGPAQVDLAEDLARRAAMALDNARLYRAAQHASARAAAASRAKSEFLATMSHELRTPINAVVGYLDLLELELAGPVNERQREQLDRIRAAARQLLGMVEQVLDLAKLESGELPVAREVAGVRDTVDEALGRVRAAADARGVRLEDACGGDGAAAFVGDPGRVGQVLDHLLSNAVKFTPAGGEVRVACSSTLSPEPSARLTSPGPWVCVEVRDTGVGIAPELLTAVFEPFRQAQGGHTRSEGGSGLGLTVARHLARAMGGDLTARSAPGRGSCFTLWLPAAPRAAGERQGEDERRRMAEALAAAGRVVTAHVDEVVDAYVRRLRADALVPHAAGSTDVDLADHAGTLVADVGQALEVLGAGADDAPELLRDGSRIQRLVAELHGEQRLRLGWSEAELRRDFEVLREEVERCVSAHLRGEGAGHAAATAGRLVRQGERVSLHAFRAAVPRG